MRDHGLARNVGSAETAPAEYGQLELPHMPIRRIGITFKTNKNALPVVEKALKPGQHVTGTFTGRVVWPKYDMDSGELTNVIEVLTAELDNG